VGLDLLEEKFFLPACDNSEQIEKLLEIIPICYDASEEIKRIIIELFSKSTSLLSFTGMLLLYLCNIGTNFDLALAIFVDFLERNTHYVNYGKKGDIALEFTLKLLLFCPGILSTCTERDTEGEVECGQYDLAKHSNTITQQSICLSIKELIVNEESPLESLFNFINMKASEEDVLEGDIFSSLEYSTTIRTLFQTSIHNLSSLGTYTSSTSITLSLPQKVWDLCSGLYIATLILGLKWTYEHAYKSYIFRLFAESKKSSRSRLAAIAFIGTLFKCQARNFPYVGDTENIYKEYLTKLVLTVTSTIMEITLHDKCWAVYWIIKVNAVNKEELIILKQWFISLSEEEKNSLPVKIVKCLSDIQTN